MSRFSRFVASSPVIALIASVCLVNVFWAAEGPAVPLAATEATVTLPATCDLERLTELVSQATGASLHWGAGKIQGSIRLSLPQALPIGELWALYNQVLGSQGLTTVVGVVPGLFQVIPLAEAAQNSRILTPAELKELPIKPGFVALLRETKSISAEAAVKLLGAVWTNQGSQLRSLGGDGHQLLIAAPTTLMAVADAVLAAVDRDGQASGVRLIKPARTSPSALQAAATAAWNALGRVDERVHTGDIQVAPDGLQLILVASIGDLDNLEHLIRELDKSEPVETRSYRPRFFTLDEVAGLIQQTLGVAAKVEIVRDRLTGSLLIKATTAEHQRIAAVITSLDEAPANARRQARALQVKHRKADEMARLLMTLVATGHTDSGGTSANGSEANSVPAATPMTIPPRAQSSDLATGTSLNSSGSGSSVGTPSVLTAGIGQGQAQAQASTPQSTAPVTATSADGSLVITADPVTNRLLILGEPRVIDQVQELLAQIDQRQPQVDLEVVLVSMTDEENRDLGVELARQFGSDGTDIGIASLFGLSAAVSGSATNRTTGNAQGLGAVVLKPGQYAAVLHALESINNGKTTIHSRLIVANNAQATLNAVVQQPFSATNSSTQVSTTSFGGTSDAGTQITLEPRISPADYVTVNYTISQSAFLGSPTVTDNGVIPPTKRTDNVASTATVPDSYTIALGGLSNRNEGHSESRIPVLGSIPWLGNLFKSQNDQHQTSRFYVFIRASILRNATFGDLRYRSEQPVKESGVGNGGDPVLEPILMH